jgi:hypothetical protein
MKEMKYLNEFHREQEEKALKSIEEWKKQPRTIEDVKRQQAMLDRLSEERRSRSS